MNAELSILSTCFNIARMITIIVSLEILLILTRPGWENKDLIFLLNSSNEKIYNIL